MKRILWLLVLALMLVGCEAPSASRDTLQKAGFTNIQVKGWSPWSCGEDDTFSTKFRAKNPLGVEVEGVVCCGLIVKACTIRF